MAKLFKTFHMNHSKLLVKETENTSLLWIIYICCSLRSLTRNIRCRASKPIVLGKVEVIKIKMSCTFESTIGSIFQVTHVKCQRLILTFILYYPRSREKRPSKLVPLFAHFLTSSPNSNIWWACHVLRVSMLYSLFFSIRRIRSSKYPLQASALLLLSNKIRVQKYFLLKDNNRQ